MKILAKISAVFLVATLMLGNTYASVETVACSSNSNFAANSCDQCFSGGMVSVGDNKGLLTDIWENNSDGPQVLFKEEQEMPMMLPLGGASWTEVQASDSVQFWQYTESLDALYDDENLGYTLGAGETVVWLESSLGSAYELVSAPVNGSEAGMLMYDLAVHNVDGGTIELDAQQHRECVLYTAGEAPTTPTTPPKELPQTGPEYVILGLIALLLGLGFYGLRRKA